MSVLNGVEQNNQSWFIIKVKDHHIDKQRRHHILYTKPWCMCLLIYDSCEVLDEYTRKLVDIFPVYMSGVEQLARCTCAGILVEVHRFLCMYVCMYNVCMQVCVHICI